MEGRNRRFYGSVRYALAGASVQLYGSLFFGAVPGSSRCSRWSRARAGLLIRLDLQSLQALDASELDVLEQLNKATALRGGKLVLEGLHAQPRAVMERSGFCGSRCAVNPRTPGAAEVAHSLWYS